MAEIISDVGRVFERITDVAARAAEIDPLVHYTIVVFPSFVFWYIWPLFLIADMRKIQPVMNDGNSLTNRYTSDASKSSVFSSRPLL
jgi:hypothetical protein